MSPWHSLFGRGRAARPARLAPRPEGLEREAPQAGPDTFALIQAYEDHFSCCIEWMKLTNEGLLGRRRSQRSRT